MIFLKNNNIFFMSYTYSKDSVSCHFSSHISSISGCFNFLPTKHLFKKAPCIAQSAFIIHRHVCSSLSHTSVYSLINASASPYIKSISPSFAANSCFFALSLNSFKSNSCHGAFYRMCIYLISLNILCFKTLSHSFRRSGHSLLYLL